MIGNQLEPLYYFENPRYFFVGTPISRIVCNPLDKCVDGMVILF